MVVSRCSQCSLAEAEIRVKAQWPPMRGECVPARPVRRDLRNWVGETSCRAKAGKVHNQTNQRIAGWRKLLWTEAEPLPVGLDGDDSLVSGRSKKVHLVCCLNCKSEVWGHPSRCPYCLILLPPRW
jgi:hypothetical protein